MAQRETAVLGLDAGEFGEDLGLDLGEQQEKIRGVAEHRCSWFGAGVQETEAFVGELAEGERLGFLSLFLSPGMVGKHAVKEGFFGGWLFAGILKVSLLDCLLG